MTDAGLPLDGAGFRSWEADPYRWLESSSAETHAWLAAHQQLTERFLARIRARGAIRQRLAELWDESPPPVVLDPNALSPHGPVRLAGVAIREDGVLVAYGLSINGSDRHIWRVHEVATGRELPGELEGVAASGVVWAPDGQGVFYNRALPDGSAALCYHVLETPQREDRVVYQRPDRPEWYYLPELSDDGRYLVISVLQGSDIRNLLLVQELADLESAPVELIGAFEASYRFVGNDGSRFWLHVEETQAPNGRVVVVELHDPAREHWHVLIPEAPEPLREVARLGDRLAALYLKDACSQLKLFALDGTPLGEVELPGRGTVTGLGSGRSDDELVYTFETFVAPAALYRYDTRTGESSRLSARQAGARSPRPHEPDEYETMQVFFTSRDGTRVPMFISYRRGIALDGNRPTYLTGYGGFNSALTPHFSAEPLVWMEMGGIYAVANVRGGGEYGRRWHQAGILQRKQRGFDDFIAAAEWLIEQGYTSPERLAIGGSSNGGLLVAACMVQRPELFGAAIAEDGLMDMLRFDRLGVGSDWICEYGSPYKWGDFLALRAYSPLHNVRAGTRYPPILLMVDLDDERVAPAHSFKFAAALQAAQGGTGAVLLHVGRGAGHGERATLEAIEAAADRLAFLAHCFGMEHGSH